MEPLKKLLVPLTQPVVELLAEGIDPGLFVKQVLVEVDPKRFILSTPPDFKHFSRFQQKLDALGMVKSNHDWNWSNAYFSIHIGGASYPGQVYWLQVANLKTQDLEYNKTFNTFSHDWEERLLADLLWWKERAEQFEPRRRFGEAFDPKDFNPKDFIMHTLPESHKMNVRGRPFEVSVFQQGDGFMAVAHVAGKQIASAPSADRMTAERDLHDKLAAQFFSPVAYDPNKAYEGLEQDLIKASRAIKHCGDYGKLYFNPATKAVHWTAADSDSPDNGYTDTRDIHKMLKLKGVSDVEVGDEWSPKEEEGWIRLDDSISPAEDLATSLLLESPQFKTLKANRRALSAEEKKQAGEAPVWKAQVNGATWYCSNTHRCFQAHKKLSAAVKAYHEIVEPSG